MFVSQVVQGRWLSAEDVEVIRCLIAGYPHWSRRRLSVAVTEAFNWRTASGQLKDMSARLLLAKLAERGIIKLPPRQRRGGGRRLREFRFPERTQPPTSAVAEVGGCVRSGNRNSFGPLAVARSLSKVRWGIYARWN